MTRVAIIGGGAFGTALACVARRAGSDVIVWAREPEVVASINESRENHEFLAGVRIPDGILATGSVPEAIAAAEIVLMACPAQHMRALANLVRPVLRPGLPVVSCAKGVELGSCQLMPELLADLLPGATLAVLSGPTFAREIANDLPCGAVVACKDWAAGEAIARAMSSPNFCVHLSDDVIGAALAGAMKNVISIASGIAAARDVGENARATIVTLGLEESTRIAVAKGASALTFLGLAGAGDFMLTAHSLQSRNTSLGVAIGQGKRAADVLAARKEVTEGAASVTAVAQLARRLHVDMPITFALDDIINGGAALEATIARLLQALPASWHAGRRRREVAHVQAHPVTY